MADLTQQEQDVLRAMQDAPPWWPGANLTALASTMQGAGTLRGRSIESISRSLRSMQRKGIVYKDGAGWHLGRASDDEQERA